MRTPWCRSVTGEEPPPGGGGEEPPPGGGGEEPPPPSETPEPSSLLLAGMALGTYGIWKHRKKTAKKDA